MVFVLLIYSRLTPPCSECTTWSRTVPSSQRFIARQASFRLSQEGAGSISFLGRLRNSSYRPPGIYLLQEDPEHPEWYLRISKTRVQPWSCGGYLEKQYSGESCTCTKHRTGPSKYCCRRSTRIYWSGWTRIW